MIITSPNDFVETGRQLYRRWKQNIEKFGCHCDEWEDLEVEDRDAWSMTAQDIILDYEVKS